jgi:GNAT superfamily N-acetyltransferase
MPAADAPHLRLATDDDVDAVRAVVHAAYGGYGPLLGRTPMPMLTDFAVAIREHEVWVAEVDDRIVGVLELIPREDHLWIDNVAIDPEHQGRGLGRRLLKYADDEARRRGYESLGLLTNERYVRNIAMYERYGYRETHRTPHLGTDLVHFRKELRADEATEHGTPA